MKTVGCLASFILCVLCVLPAAPAAAAVSLSNGYVTPSMGGTTTLFTFYVTYKDTSGAAPVEKQLCIDPPGYVGPAHWLPPTMTLVAGSYATGAVFRYQTRLLPGTHKFGFYFAIDSPFAFAVWPSGGVIEGPRVSPVYNVTDYFPLTGTWKYLTNYGTEATGIETRTVSAGGSPVTLQCNFTSADGSIVDDWVEYWSKDASGVFWHGMTDDGKSISLTPPFRIPNGLYVGQTATSAHTVSATGRPSVKGWCTYRLEAVETISGPYTRADCLKLTISISSRYLLVRNQMWLAYGLGEMESVGADEGTCEVHRLFSRTP